MSSRANAVPSYSLFPGDQTLDPAQVRERVNQLGFDGMVVFRIAAVDKQATWVPGTYMGPSYAFGAWPVYDPGYIRTDTVVRVETDVYSLPDDRLIWASTSRTYDPKSTRSLVADVTKAVGKAMRKQGLVRG